MWIDNPDKAGFWLFVGLRATRSLQFSTQIAAPCLVKDDKAYPEWMVYYTAQGSAYGLSQHKGSWYFLGDILDEKFRITFTVSNPNPSRVK